jgi:hypothetical protein
MGMEASNPETKASLLGNGKLGNDTAVEDEEDEM